MTNIPTPITIEYVEDSKSWRNKVGAMLSVGLKRENVIFNVRPDFYELSNKIRSNNPADLPDILILDHSAPGGSGALLAIEAYNKAQDIGKDLILIEVLTTSPFTVYKDYGDSLDKLHIPVLDKEMHAFLSGFYTAACITDTGVQRLSYEDWLDREQIHANPNSHISDIADLQEEFLYDVAKRPGSLYLGPRRYIQEYHDELTQSMGTETTELLHRMFPPQISGKERKG